MAPRAQQCIDTLRRMAASPFAWTVFGMCVCAFAYLHYITWTQLASHRVFLADVGVFDTIAAGPRHGHFLRSPLDWTAPGNYFGVHFRPVFFLIMPFYLIHDGALTYLALQNLALVLAAAPLALYARTILRSSLLAVAFAVLYLSNHFVGSVHLSNHVEVMCFPFWFLAFWAVEKQLTWTYAIACLGVLSVKEDMAIYLGLFGAAQVFHKDSWRKRVGIATIAGAIAWGVLALAVSRFCGAEAIADAGNKPISRWASMGSSTGDVAGYMISHPHVVLARLFRPSLLWLFASTGFLALLDWRAFWLIIISAGFFVVADDAALADLLYYYSYSAIPFLFYCSVRGTAVLLEKARHRASVPLAVYVFALAIPNAVLPTRADGLRRVPFAVTPHHELGAELIRDIPSEASVAAQYDLFNVVPNRKVKLPMRLWALDHVDYVFLDLKGRPADLYGEEKREEAQALYDRLFSPEYEDVIGMREAPDETDGYLLLRRAKTTE